MHGLEVTIAEPHYYEALYLNARPGGGTMRTSLHFLKGMVDGLPLRGRALVATADLQGRVESGDSSMPLLGHWLGENLVQIHKASGLPPPGRMSGHSGRRLLRRAECRYYGSDGGCYHRVGADAHVFWCASGCGRQPRYFR